MAHPFWLEALQAGQKVHFGKVTQPAMIACGSDVKPTQVTMRLSVRCRTHMTKSLSSLNFFTDQGFLFLFQESRYFCLSRGMSCLSMADTAKVGCRRGSRVAPAPLDSAQKVQAALQARQHREAQMALERRALTGADASTSGQHARGDTPDQSLYIFIV